MIRQLFVADAPAYRELRLEVLRLEPDAYLSSFETERQKPELFMERCLKIAGASNIVYGAFADDKLIGIAGFAANQSEIIQFYVDAQHRGRGTGRKLLSVLIDDIFTRFQSLDSINIAVIATPRNAGSLYQSLGFVSCKLDIAAANNFDIISYQLQRQHWRPHA